MSNPFNKLKVHRDSDDDEGFTPVGKGAPQQDSLFKKPEAKKPKQRPKEEKPEEKAPVDDNQEGFEVVGKQPKKTYNQETVEEGTEKGHTHKATKDHRDRRHEGQFRSNNPDKRVFDRQSGTGRGKEVAKDGAGGKGTWGNQLKSAKREVVDYDDTEYYFQKALNPKKEEITKIVEKTVEPVVEVQKEAAVEEEAKPEKEHKERKGKKGVVNPEVDEKDKLVIPENAISYNEWKQQNKRTEVKAKEIKVEVNHLEPIVKKNDETIQVGAKVVVEKKKKAKEVNKKEEELNKILASSIAHEEAGSKQNKKNYGNNHNKGFKFTESDFPELK